MDGLEYPTKTSEDGKVSPKFELKWSNAEDEAAIGNYHALNALFNDVDQNVFKLINAYTSVKQA